MGLEHLFAELLVASVFDGVDLESVRVGVDVVLLGEDVADGVEGGHHAQDHRNDHHGVGNLVSAEERNILSDVVGHLWGRRGGAVVILDHAIMELWGHGNDHVVIVRVEVPTLRHVDAEGSSVVVTSEQVIWVVGHTRLHGTGLGELGWPHTHVRALGLVDGEIWWPDSVMDLSLAVVPLLEVVSSMLLMSWMDLGQVDHEFLQLHLFETFVHKQIVLLMHGTVASRAGSAENLEASPESTEIIKLAPISENSELGCQEIQI